MADFIYGSIECPGRGDFRCRMACETSDVHFIENEVLLCDLGAFRSFPIERPAARADVGSNRTGSVRSFSTLGRTLERSRIRIGQPIVAVANSGSFGSSDPKCIARSVWIRGNGNVPVIAGSVERDFLDECACLIK